MIELTSFIITFMVICTIIGIGELFLCITIDLLEELLPKALESKNLRRIIIYPLCLMAIGGIIWYFISIPSQVRIVMLIIFGVAILIFILAAWLEFYRSK